MNWCLFLVIEYIYVWVRTDIPLAQQMVQACHASVLAGRDFQHHNDTHLVLLSVANEEELKSVAFFLESIKTKFQIFYEPDLFGEDEMGYTAIASEIISEDRRPEFYQYNLWSDPNDGNNPRSSRELFDCSCRRS